MNDDEWRTRAAAELYRRAVAAPLIDQVLGEAELHAADSGQPADLALGMPEVYAARLARSLAERVPAGSPAPGRIRLAAAGLGKRFGRRWVFRGVDVEVRGGQAVAVVGANGSGKSTLLGICAGFVRPTEGTVTLDGRVGFCPQYGGTFDHLGADEHFALVGAARGMRRAEAHRSGRRLAAALQWNPASAGDGWQARYLSGGTRQKLNLTLAALGDPEIMLLDEPYQGFDQGSFLDFWDQVLAWRDQGKAVVVVTHILENLDRVDRVVDLTMAGRPA